MDGVGFFAMLLIGVIAGWLAEKFTSSNHGLLTNIVVGIAGAFIGGLVAGALGISVRGFWGTLIAAVIGAVLLIVIMRAIMGRRTTA